MKKPKQIKKLKKTYTKKEIKTKLLKLLDNINRNLEELYKYSTVFNKFTIEGRKGQKEILEYILKKYF